MTALLIDLAIIGIVVFCAWRGYRNGLIRGVFGVATLILALFFANIAAEAYSEEFEGMLAPFVGGIVDTALTELHSGAIEYEFTGHENDSEAFRTAFAVLRQIGLPVSASIRIAELTVEEGFEGQLSDVIAEKLSATLAYISVFAIAFVIVAIVFAVVGNLIGFVFSLPGLKLLDIIAGVAFGFVKGLIIVLAMAAVIRYYGLLALETLEGTTVLDYLVSNNIIANMLGI